jgi:hypothetical protein
LEKILEFVDRFLPPLGTTGNTVGFSYCTPISSVTNLVASGRDS